MRDAIGVSALLSLLKQSLGRVFHTVLVSGEVLDPLLSQRGHFYFRLTDGQSEIRAVMWKREAERLRALPKPGDQVTVRAGLDLYAPRGDLQLVVSALMQSGRGQKLLELARLKEKLKSEGVFDRPRKDLPSVPLVVGVVTSVGSAVIHDIYQSVQARWPACRLVLSPTSVSGQHSAMELVAALEKLRDRTQVVIVARGGGSFEELLPFSDERLVRAVADFPQPVVAAVGHGSDITLLDLAADHTAPTPTAAAVLVTPDREDLRRGVFQAVSRLHRALRSRVEVERLHLQKWMERSRSLHPAARVSQQRSELDATRRRLIRWLEDLALSRRLALDRSCFTLRSSSPEREARLARERLEAAILRLETSGVRTVAARRSALDTLTARLHAAGPQAILERGYALLKAGGQVVSTVRGRTIGEEMELHLADGRLVVTITRIG